MAAARRRIAQLVISALPVVVLPILLSGCLSNVIDQLTGPAAAQSAAQDFNLNTRFGRMELAAESVAPKAREAFVEKHKTWGGAVRIADSELAGMHVNKPDDVDIIVRVAWYGQNVSELRVTTCKQRWHATNGIWRYVSEQRVAGDPGLLGDYVAEKVQAPREAAQFPTVRIGESDPQ